MDNNDYEVNEFNNNEISNNVLNKLCANSLNAVNNNENPWIERVGYEKAAENFDYERNVKMAIKGRYYSADFYRGGMYYLYMKPLTEQKFQE